MSQSKQTLDIDRGKLSLQSVLYCDYIYNEYYLRLFVTKTDIKTAQINRQTDRHTDKQTDRVHRNKDYVDR